MICERCKQRGQTWNGSPPECAFEQGVFSPDNWNCATMNDLRDMCEDDATVWNEDHNACVLRGADACTHVVLYWYKQRGNTEGAWMLYDHRPPAPLTLAEAELMIANDQVDRRGIPRPVERLVGQSEVAK